MSEAAFQVYQAALTAQHTRNEARRIRARVNEARQNPHPAALRWPFELLQNALDAGPRPNKSSVTVRLCREPSKLIFEHDGMPFTSEELAALLSGGSSKEFESDITTGRFGTGFLVTHVLADTTTLRGVLQVPNGYERFELVLDRSGDEDRILSNINLCNAAIRDATAVLSFETISSASFEYPIQSDDFLILGFESLRQALPYLYGTRPSLGRVIFEFPDGTQEVWDPGEPIQIAINDGHAEYRSIQVKTTGGPSLGHRVYKFSKSEFATACALALATTAEGKWHIQMPAADAPRMHREYPLRGSSFVPINFVLNGKFDPDQERVGLLMSNNDKAYLEDALAGAVIGLKYTCDQGFDNAHLLAYMAVPSTTFDTSNTQAETEWWRTALAACARQMAALPVVECVSGRLPAVSADGPYADFIVPRLSLSSRSDETTVDRLWPLLAATDDLCPALRERAADWTSIAEGWHALGLPLGRITLSELARSARGNSTSLDDLAVTGDTKQWIALFIDVVGESWVQRKGIDLAILEGMIPNQSQQLCSPGRLQRDGGISSTIKDIGVDIGSDIRSGLVLDGFDQLAALSDLKFLTTALADAVPTSLSEDDAIKILARRLDEQLPEGKECDDDSQPQQNATAKLLHYLWEAHGPTAPSAKNIPLIAINRRSTRWSGDRMMMAPISNWHVSAQPFSDAYPPQRVLADLYSGHDGVPNCVAALIDFGMAIADPLSRDTPSELRELRLAAISNEDTEGVVISGVEFSQIALLQPELLNRCQERPEEARALLGLVLCHIAPHDLAWTEERRVKARRARSDVEVTVRGALWLGDLKSRAWVPVPGEDEKPVKMIANASTLGQLLEPKWLEENEAAIRLLSEWFGFDRLDLRLHGLALDESKRRLIRDGLARLVETGGPDPSFYTSLADQIATQQRQAKDIERHRRLGIAVQEAIKAAMEEYGLNLTLVDRGFDYKIDDPVADLIHDSSMSIQIGSYLLEVKATTTGSPRLTSTQAHTASSYDTERYVLCVVDLSSLSEQELNAEWTAARVEPLAKLTAGIGSRVKETCTLVDAAATRSVAIRNAAALRYEVPTHIWSAGISISEWVASILTPLKNAPQVDSTDGLEAH